MITTRSQTKDSNAKNPAKSELDQLNEGIVTVKFIDGRVDCDCRRFRNRTFYGVKRADPLGLLFEKFTSHRSSELSNLRFLYDERRCYRECTPNSLNVELDEDVMMIDVFRGQPCSLCYPLNVV